MRQIFGAWKPDQPAHLQDGLVRAHGVVPIANGYAPLPSFAAAPGGTLPGPCVGAGAYRTSEDVHVFAATVDSIYRYGATGHVAIRSGLSSSSDVGVRFCAYNRTMLATNGLDPIQTFDPGAPTTMTPLAAGAPTARFLAVVRGFVVAGYAANDALRVAWSDNGDPVNWTAGTGEAGFQIMASGGDITGVVGGEYGLIFQENRIVRMSYTADDAIWQFDEIATDIGCIAPWSLATYGKLSFFLSNKGFMACDGVTVEAIGIETVDRAFLSMLDRTYLDRMSAAVDPRSSTFIVSVPSANPATQVYLFQFALRRWTTASLTSERIFPALAQSVSLDALDAAYGGIDAGGWSIDSAMLRGGYPLLMLFDGSHRLGTLSGSNMAATLVDGLKEFVPGGKARIRSVRPLTDAALTTIALLGADGLSDSLDETSHEMRTASGVHRMRRSCGFCSVKLSIPAATAWTYAQGYDVDFAAGGRA